MRSWKRGNRRNREEDLPETWASCSHSCADIRRTLRRLVLILGRLVFSDGCANAEAVLAKTYSRERPPELQGSFSTTADYIEIMLPFFDRNHP